MSFLEVNKVSCEVSQVPDLWFFEVSFITAYSYMKRKKYLNTGNTTKDTQKAHSDRAQHPQGRAKTSPEPAWAAQEHPYG